MGLIEKRGGTQPEEDHERWEDLQPHGYKGSDMRGGKSQQDFHTIFFREKLVCIHPILSIHFLKVHFNVSENRLHLSVNGVFNCCQSARLQLSENLSLTPPSKNLKIII